MNTPTLSTHADPAKSRFAMAARVEQIDRTARALAAHGFTVEVLDDAQAARTRVAALLPLGAAVYTAASETLRLSGIDADINSSDASLRSSRASGHSTARRKVMRSAAL
jgi:hypothetical protein